MTLRLSPLSQLSRLARSRFLSGSFCLFLTTVLGAASTLSFKEEPLPAESYLWVALRTSDREPSMIVHPGVLLGSSRTDRLFLPFPADRLIRHSASGETQTWTYRDFAWHADSETSASLTANPSTHEWSLRLAEGAGEIQSWLTFREVDGLLGAGAIHYVRMGEETYLPFFFTYGANGEVERRSIYGRPEFRPRVYQMLPRLFGNTNETRKINGTLEENGVGRFSDLSREVLRDFRREGITHVWVTGVLQQATSTDYSDIGEPADDPDLLKGIAGSPYAIRDYFDVSPDYADNPANRREEFRALLDRAEEEGVKIVIDLVANHVARSYNSTVRPDLSFGNNDRTNVFFHPENNFFYLTPEVVRDGTQAPLILPTVDPRTGEVTSETARLVGGADGRFEPETRIGRVTGNNVVSWQPSEGDWYETVKLNFGFNFLRPDQDPSHPSIIDPSRPIPDTWRKMDEIIAYWQEMGVDGFRADMAHMIPPEFWKWAINRARQRDPEVFFFAEAYDDDPARVRSREPVFLPRDGAMIALLDAGFHAVYDDPSYDALEYLYEDKATANELDRQHQIQGPFFFDAAIRYMENHDEPRLAHPETFGGNGAEVGRPLTGLMFAFSRGPVMLYHGQEVGEPALGREGFGGDDTRTTIFDYWSMPEFNKWWNDGARDGGRLSPEQRDLRAWYVRLLQQAGHPALALGNFYPLNPTNRDNPFYGRITDLGESGHWLYAFVRYDPESGARLLVVANLHPSFTLRHQRLRLTREQWEAIGLTQGNGTRLRFRDILSEEPTPFYRDLPEARREGIYIPELPPFAIHYFEMEAVPAETALAEPIFPITAKPSLGASPTFRLRSGEERVIDLLRLGQPGTTHRFDVSEVDGLSLSLDTANHRLRIRPEPGRSGLIQLPLALVPDEWLGTDGEALSTTLLLAIEEVPQVKFRVTAARGSRIQLVGDFNGWNQSSDPFVEIAPGEFELQRFIAPGRYRYKIIINGNWSEDPSATLSEPDGYGGRNSILVVADPSGGTQAPTLTFLKEEGSRLHFHSDLPLRGEAVFADVLASTQALALPVSVEGQQISVTVANLPAGTRVRALAEGQSGQVSREAIAVVGGEFTHLWERDILYYAFTDRFKDGDPSNNHPISDPELGDIANYKGGDFAGIQQAIEAGYFDRLGVSSLWLAPVYQNPAEAWREYLPPYRKYSGYHGYWPVSMTDVEHRFGGAEALDALVSSAHERSIRVLADLVLKHVHKTNPVFAGQPDIFGQLLAADGEPNLRRWNDEPFSTWFEPFLPGFDFTNPKAHKFLLENTLYWLREFRFDGYRLDAVKHVLPDFWWRFRAAIEEAFPGHNFYFVGETFHDREGIMDFVGPGMLDGQFDFPLYDAIMDTFARGSGDFLSLESALKQSELVYGRAARMSPLLGNHDKVRFMGYADGDLPDPEEPDPEEVAWIRPPVVNDPASYRKLKMAATFLYAVDGVPMVYYGDEIGMTGAGDPDNRRMMRFGNDVSVEEASVFEHFSRLGQARRNHPALFLGSRAVLHASPHQYAFLRQYGDDTALIVFNRADQAARLQFDLPASAANIRFRDVLSGHAFRNITGTVNLELPARTSALYIRE